MTGHGADENESVGVAAVAAATAVVTRYRQAGCPDGTRIEVEVCTPVALGHALEADVTEQLQRLPRALPPLQSVGVLFRAGATRSVSAHVRPVHGGPEPAPSPVPEPRPATGPTPPARHLRLVWDGAELGFHLPPLRGPVALLRPVSSGTTAPDAIRLPPGLAVVPSGHLLDIVPDGGGHAVRRTAERDGVEVTVDGVPLAPDGGQRRLGESGTLRFTAVRGTAGVLLDYELLAPDAAGPDHRAATVEGDLEPEAVRVRADFEPVDILVDPPAALDVARPQFPVWVEEDVWLVADQLTTTGVTVGGTQRWHVKLYLCATAQHAAGLRSHLGERSEAIGRLNARARSTGAVDGEQLAMTPVYVARPPSEAAPVEHTVARPVAEPLVGGPGSGFVGWFARGDNLDPDRVVVTVSRWFAPVEWTVNPATPGLEQLDKLRPVGVAIDLLHELGWSHGDVKPQNVCWQPGGRYVLVDADSLVRTGRVDDLRPTWAYASRAVREALMPVVGADPAAAVTAPLRGPAAGTGAGYEDRGAHTGEHDRFGFALLVLTALGGKGLTDALVETVDRPAVPVAGGSPDRPPERRVDRPGEVGATLWNRWPGGRPALIGALQEAFAEPVLRGAWSAAGWLGRVADRAAADPAELGPRDRPEEPWEPDPSLRGIHRAVLADQVRAADRAAAAAVLLTEEIRRRAEDTARRYALYTSSLVLLLGVVAVLVLVALLTPTGGVR
ncbi:hypothetical protein WHI96_11460 [Pseudonocardia tropica]|uniref:Protein kinase domain-containing protein n=1 Tax=Pseudonocardia tropica TaxID=681289 RepID=A0ABV1JU08_9PSEU